MLPALGPGQRDAQEAHGQASTMEPQVDAEPHLQLGSESWPRGKGDSWEPGHEIRKPRQGTASLQPTAKGLCSREEGIPVAPETGGHAGRGAGTLAPVGSGYFSSPSSSPQWWLAWLPGHCRGT